MEPSGTDVVSDEQRVRAIQIIAAAMLAGVAALKAVMVFLAAGRDEEAAQPPLVAWVAAGFAGLVLVAHRPVAAAVGRASTGDAGTRFFTRTLILLALLEGAALFNAIAYLIDGQVLSLAAVAALVAAMLLAFPTTGKFEAFADPHPWEKR